MMPFLIAGASPSGYRQSHAHLLITVSESPHLAQQQEVSWDSFCGGTECEYIKSGSELNNDLSSSRWKGLSYSTFFPLLDPKF